MMQNRIVNPYVKYDYSKMTKDLQKLQKRYGSVTSCSIGKTMEGREIFSAQIGCGEKKVLFVGAHHAREYITSAYLMQSMELICALSEEQKLVQGIRMDKVLEEKTLHFVPMLNPDGVNISIFGPEAAQYPERIYKMRLIGPAYDTWKANANGVDLNRSYPCLFDQKSSLVSSPASELYKGAHPGRELEVAALMDFCSREGFSLSATFHSKGEEIHWADRNSGRIEGAEEAAKAVAEISGYRLMPPSVDPGGYAAGFENWFRERFRKPCLRIELSPFIEGAVPHPMKYFDWLVWENAKYILPVLANFN